MAKTTSAPVVVDTSGSPYARLRPVPVNAVNLADSFWAPRWRLNRDVTIPTQYQLLEETGRIDNFRRAAGKVHKPFQGYYYNDSDVYKWLEACAWTLASEPVPAIQEMADAVIAEIIAAQEPNGYLNTHFTFEKAGERWTNLRDMHELYCAGHLIQAAIAHQRMLMDSSRRGAAAQGEPQSSLLRAALRLADHICQVFGPPETGKRPGTCGHPEIEMALVELARLTGEERYRAQAQYFLDARGHGLIGGSPYHQDHKPFREFDRMDGHAVRALYLNCGAADLYAEAGEKALRAALDRQWANMVERQLYVTAGAGSRWDGEAFGSDYELPNARAYAETCAAIALIMWAWRMLALDGHACYSDLMETALYNGFLAGVGLDGKSYFYVNPLADDGAHRRQPWYSCACCPPNIARIIASLPGYFYSVSPESIWVHLYAASSARLALPDGRQVSLRQETRYPWEGEVAITVQGEGEFSLRLRIPGWCENGATLRVAGRPWEAPLTPGSYAEVRCTWRAGDAVVLSLPMPVRCVQSHPYALENTGRVALMRGPLVYCLEGVDHPGVELRDVILPGEARLSTEFRPDLLNGVVVLRGPARVVPPDSGWEHRLYRTVPESPGRSREMTTEITAIPYYAWANREPGQMQVWVRKG